MKQRKRKKVEQELKDAIEARDEFLSVASHELKPLSLHSSSSYKWQNENRGLKRQEIYSHELIHSINVSLKQVNRLTYLIEDLLEYF